MHDYLVTRGCRRSISNKPMEQLMGATDHSKIEADRWWSRRARQWSSCNSRVMDYWSISS